MDVPEHYGSNVKNETVLGYALLEKMLDKYMHLPFNANAIKTRGNGKPYHKDATYYFNISYCRDYIACALGLSELGIDIEQNRNIPERIYPKILTKEEQARNNDPLQTWVIKEAYGKYLGIGTALSFSTTSVDDIVNQQAHKIWTNTNYTCALFFDNTKPDPEVNCTFNELNSK